MNTVWQTVRVFISSTFRDMQAERDWLVKRVFPALRQRLEPHRIHLVDIDLRWGITQKQAENNQVLELCLQQIDECRPFFLGLLGGRYGWVPSRLPASIVDSYAWTQAQNGKSITELEILHGVLNDPAMRGRAIFCFRDERFLDAITNWKQRTVYTEVSTPEELYDLGHEEAARRAWERVNYLRDLKQRIKDLSPPMMLLDGYPCEWNPTRNDPGSKIPGRLKGLEEFGNWILENLEQTILKAPELQQHFVDLHTQTRNDHNEERGFHERFIENRTRVYVQRRQLHAEMKAFVLGKQPKPCLVAGPSGSGKSAALAHFVRTWRTQHPQEVIISHFVGASPRSTSLYAMLRNLCTEMKEAFKLEDEVEQNVSKLSDQFREFLEKRVPKGCRVVLVLDSLNQLDKTDNAHSLDWLPLSMPSQVRLMVSCITDSDHPDQLILETIRRRKPQEIKVGQLTDGERLGIAREIPSMAAKMLDEAQIGLLLKNPATENPLFLLVALEELRGLGSLEELNRNIAGLPKKGDTLTAIFQQVIRRLQDDFDVETVKHILMLLACSRFGLSERELLDLLEGEKVQIEDSDGDLFPILRQLRPYLQSRDSLLDYHHRHLAKAIDQEFFASDKNVRSEVHFRLAEYFHRQDNYLSLDRDVPVQVNSRKMFELPYQRLRVASLGHGSAAESSHWNSLADLLTNGNFLEAKTRGNWTGEINDIANWVRTSMVADLFHDLRNTVDSLPRVHHLAGALETLAEFFSRHLIQLARSPHSLASQLSIDFTGNEGKLGELARIGSINNGFPELLRCNLASKRVVPSKINLPFRSNIADIASIPGSSDVLICSQGGDIVRADAQRRFIKAFTQINTPRLLCIEMGAGKSIYALGREPVLRFLDPVSLIEFGSLPIAISEAGWVAYSKSANLIAVGGLEEVELFRPQEKKSVRVLYPDRIKVSVPYGTNMVEFSRSGVYLAIACHSGDVLVYNLALRQFLEQRGYCGQGALSLVFENESTLWAGSFDGNLLRWDLSSSKIRYFRTDGDPVESLLWSDQEQIMVSGHHSGSIRVWDGSASEPLLNINLTTKWIRALATTDDSINLLVGTNEIFVLPIGLNELRSISVGERQPVASSLNPKSRRLLVATGEVMEQFTETDQLVDTPIGSIARMLHMIVEDGQATISERPSWEEPDLIYGTALCQAREGNSSFIGCSDGTVLGHDASSGEPILVFLDETSPITAIACNPKGTRLIYAAGRSINVAEMSEDSIFNYKQRARLGRSLKAFPLLMFIGKDHFLLDAGQPLTIDGDAKKEVTVPASTLEIRQFRDLDKVSDIEISKTFSFAAFSPRHNCLIAIEGDSRFIVNSTSKLTNKREFGYGSIVPVSTSRYGIWKIQLEGMPKCPTFASEPELIADGPPSAPVGIDILDGLDLIAVLARDGSLTLWKFWGGELVQEVALRSKGLVGPVVAGEYQLFCADSGQGRENGPEIYNLELTSIIER